MKLKILLVTLAMSSAATITTQAMEQKYKDNIQLLRDRATIAYGAAQWALLQIDKAGTLAKKGKFGPAQGKILPLIKKFSNLRLVEDAGVIKNQLIAAAKENKDMADYIKERTGTDYSQ